MASIEDGFKNPKHRQKWNNTLKTYAEPIADMAIADVATEDVLRCVQPIWLEKPETASRVRGRIEKVLDAAKAKGLRDGENPARMRGHLEIMLPKRSNVSVKHHAALPYTEMAAFVVDLRVREGIAAKALEFAILTAARSGEVRGMTWGEVDLNAKLWTVPASRMKAAEEHQVPLPLLFRPSTTTTGASSKNSPEPKRGPSAARPFFIQHCQTLRAERLDLRKFRLPCARWLPTPRTLSSRSG